MIRQTINCDICAVENQASSHWFVAVEHNGELKLRAWEPTRGSRKHMKHLCGQKCIQRLISNFTEGVKMAVQSAEVAAKETPVQETSAQEMVVRETVVRETTVQDYAQEDYGQANPRRQAYTMAARMQMDPAMLAAAESESWAGPVRLKEPVWEHGRFAHAARAVPAQTPSIHRTA